MKSSYNFRYQSERERFFDDVVNDIDDIREKKGTVFSSGIRVIFEIGEFSEKERIKSEERRRLGKSEFKGLKTFRDLDALKKFLDSSDKGGSGIQWGRKDLKKWGTRARLVRYKKQNNRIVGEQKLKEYNITLTKE